METAFFQGRWLGVLTACWLLLSGSASRAGEPLVVQSADGKFIPAAASEWGRAGENRFRFLLKSGLKAGPVAEQLRTRLPDMDIQAPDDVSLVFHVPGLNESDLLTRLAKIPLGADKAIGDALAALSGLDSASAGPPGSMPLDGLGSAGSIRASKSFKLPELSERKREPTNLIGEVIAIKPADPLPLLEVRVISGPIGGPFERSFSTDQRIEIRAYVKLKPGTRQLDESDDHTRLNLKIRDLLPGHQIFGKPLAREKGQWVLETIERMLPPIGK